MTGLEQAVPRTRQQTLDRIDGNRIEDAMRNSIQQIKSWLHSIPELYHRLILLVGPTGTGKTETLHELAEEIESPIINVNLALSSELLEFTAKQRALRLPEIFSRLTEQSNGTLLLDNLEILFDDQLKQDPLRLLQNISRNRSVVASWNGCVTRGKLVYAEPGHAEYRSYDIDDLMIVEMNEQSIADTVGS